MSGALRVVLIAVVLYLAYAAVLFFAQRSLLYPGRALSVAGEDAPLDPGVERHWLATPSGRVEAWLLGPLPPDSWSSPRPAVIWFHGNGELIDDWVDLLDGVRALGLTVLLVEYPGYGRSDGAPSEKSIRAAATAAYDLLAAREDVDRERIAAFGRSLGAGPACALARERPLAALLLHSPFTSVRAFAHRYFVPSILVRDVFDNLSVVSSFEKPVLVLHGRLDGVVPYSHGERLAAAARRGRLISYDTPHNAPPMGRLAQDVGDFLREHGVLPAPAGLGEDAEASGGTSAAVAGFSGGPTDPPPDESP